MVPAGLTKQSISNRRNRLLLNYKTNILESMLVGN